jgi:hypothetical protein
MGPDPKPNNLVPLDKAHGAVVDVDADGVDWFPGMHALKRQAGVVRIVLKLFVGVPGLLLNRKRKSLERFSETRGRP